MAYPTEPSAANHVGGSAATMVRHVRPTTSSSVTSSSPSRCTNARAFASSPLPSALTSFTGRYRRALVARVAMFLLSFGLPVEVGADHQAAHHPVHGDRHRRHDRLQPCQVTQ